MRDWNKINADMDKSKRNFDIMFRVVIGFIAVVFVVILGSYVTLGVLVAKAADGVSTSSGGIKPLIEKIWCGSEGCMK